MSNRNPPASNRWRALLAVTMALLVAGAGCSSLPGLGGGDGAGSASVDVGDVPADADAVAYADVSGLLDDENHRTVANAVLNASATTTGPQNVSAALDRARSTSGLDPTGVRELVVFSRTPETGTEMASESVNYSAAIVATSWSESELVAAIENESDTTLTEGEYNGKTTYRTSGDSEETGFVAVLSEGKFAVGTEAAVKDAVDVAVGDADALSGDLRSAYDGTREDAYLRFAVSLPSEAPTGGVGQPGGANLSSAFQKIEVVSGAEYTDGDSVGVTTTLHTTDASAASDIHDTVDGLVSLGSSMVENEHLTKVLDSVTVQEPEDASVTVTYEQPTGEITALIDFYLGQMMGAGAAR